MIDPAILPTWIDQETWYEFRQHRREVKARMTELAEKHLLRKLEQIHQAGFDVNEAMSTSIANGWRGVFAPGGGGNGKRYKTTAERVTENTEKILREFGADDPGGAQQAERALPGQIVPFARG